MAYMIAETPSLQDLITENAQYKGQMVCKGLVWGTWYPCLLEPVK